MTSVGWARWLEPLRNVARPVRALIRRLDHSVYLWLLRRVAPESRATADRRSIHLLVAGLGMGGTHRHIVALARGLVSRGFRCKVWVIEERGGSFTDEVRRTGATVDGVFTGLGPIGAFARLVYRLVTVPGVLLSLRLRKDTPLVLQCFHDEINIVGALAGRLARVPVVALGLRSVHPRDPGWSGAGHWRNPYDLLNARSFDALIVNSEAGRRSFSFHEPWFPSEKIHVVPSCVVPPIRTSTESRHKPTHPPIVLWMARMSSEKRPDLFVALLARLKGKSVPFHAWIAGQGRELGAMRQLVEVAGLSTNASFLGTTSVVGDLLDAASVLVLCSDVEGLPNSILEAHHAGCPVVATAVGGVPELIVDCVNGLLVPPGDVEALAARVTDVISDPALAQRLADAGRTCAAGRLPQNVMVDRTLQAYGLRDATNGKPEAH